jgi:hypothetical protein
MSNRFQFKPRHVPEVVIDFCKPVSEKEPYRIRKMRESIAFRKKELFVLRDMIRDFLKDKACVDCGMNDQALLDFDHVHDGRSFRICHALRLLVSPEELMREMRKCELRCRNCHVKRHWPDEHDYLSDRMIYKLLKDHAAKSGLGVNGLDKVVYKNGEKLLPDEIAAEQSDRRISHNTTY